METAVAKQSEAKKKSQPVTEELAETPSSLESELGSSAGMPLFLQRSQTGMQQQLQRSYGNSYVGSLIQAKLTVGQPGDVYEQEADKVADAVMRMPDLSVSVGTGVTNHVQPMQIQQMCTTCQHEEEEQIHPKESVGQVPTVTPALETRLNATSGGGEPLPESVRTFMEPRIGADFSGVRVHIGGEANALNQELNSQAFTRRRDVYFGAEKYSPESEEGQRLLAHELVHVVQQTVGQPSATMDSTMPTAESIVTPKVPTDSVQRQHDGGTSDGGATDTAPTQVTPKPPAGDKVITVGTVELSAEQAYDRAVLEEYIIQHGEAGADTLLGQLKAMLSDVSANKSDYSGVTPEYEALVAKQTLLIDVQKASQDALTEIKAENAKFLTEFEMRSKIVLGAMLNISEERVLKEQQHYGLETKGGVNIVGIDPKTQKKYTTHHVGADYSMAEGAAKTELSKSAKQLAEKLKTVAEKRSQKYRYLQSNDPYNTSPFGHQLVPTDQAQYDRAEQEFQDAKFAYLMLRNTQLQDYPILASFALANADAGTVEIDDSVSSLEKISTSSPDTAKVLNEEVNQKLENIGNTRWYLDRNELNIWKLESIVGGTKDGLGVQPGSMKDRIVNDKVAHEESQETITKIAIGVIALALGLIAAIPTGGSSLAAAVAVTAAVGSAGLSATLAYSDLKEYALKSAVSGTDFDKAQAISQDDPSMFWLAVSLVGVGLDLGAALSAFKALGPAARAARQAKRLSALAKAGGSEAETAEKALKQLIEEADRVRPGLGAKLETNVGHVASEEAQTAERIATRWEQEGLNSDSRKFLEEAGHAEVRALYKEMDPGIRDLLTHCASICIIPNITRRDVARIQNIVYRHEAAELGGLKQFFHFRRNNLSQAINELEQAKNLEELKAIIQGTLTASPIQATEDAVLTYERLEKAVVQLESKEAFIEKYKAGLRYDEVTRTWYNPVKGLKDAFPLTATTSEILTSLKASEGFGSFRDVLLQEKLATDEKLLEALEKLSPRGRSIDAVRHELKALFKESLLQRMTDPGKTAIENYQEMRRLTDNLASSDRGNLFEQWYKRIYAIDATEHIKIKAEDLQLLGSTAGKDRIPDLIQGDTIRELKRVSGTLGEHDLEQFADNMRLIGKKGGFNTGTGATLKRAIYTFPIPEGVKANVDWMRRQLAENPNLTFEVFNHLGDKRLITQASELSEPKFWTWLGIAK
jgi:Domain of unknown function (DUF4157)